MARASHVWVGKNFREQGLQGPHACASFSAQNVCPTGTSHWHRVRGPSFPNRHRTVGRRVQKPLNRRLGPPHILDGSCRHLSISEVTANYHTVFVRNGSDSPQCQRTHLDC